MYPLAGAEGEMTPETIRNNLSKKLSAVNLWLGSISVWDTDTGKLTDLPLAARTFNLAANPDLMLWVPGVKGQLAGLKGSRHANGRLMWKLEEVASGKANLLLPRGTVLQGDWCGDVLIGNVVTKEPEIHRNPGATFRLKKLWKPDE